MSGHAGLKRVIKTVHTKKGTKRQTFWVKAAAKVVPKGKDGKRRFGGLTGKHVGALAAFGAAAGTAAALYQMHKGKKTTSGNHHAGVSFSPQSSGMGHAAIDAFKARGNATHGLSGASFGAQRWGSAPAPARGFFAGLRHARA